MKITKFAIEVFTFNTRLDLGKVDEHGNISIGGADFSGLTPKGDGFGKVDRMAPADGGSDTDYNDLHSNIYMTSSINSEGNRFVFSGSLSAPGEPSDGTGVAALGIFISEIQQF